ncbi:restriction endonuclease subunit S [Stutzerimonas frequens]|uniref:restriction endonuclease subunit S n=1 Tax=Stutzerimonas frequens TaxID=2968969 RepID=UPI001AAF529C|nr:restriction endonuclease subunit S [Stutzerimonas frequens]QTF55366.1 restriction endonuclease subunit S [Stutzerimonas frequens]
MKWPQKKLGQVADFLLGKMLDEKKNKGEFRPYLANVNVRWGRFELGSLREMRFELHEHERYGLQFGDIVMCEGGEPGRCAIWKNQAPGMMFQKALHRIRPAAELDVGFLYYSFLNRGKNGGFDQYCTGSTIKHLPRQNLAMVEVEVPPLTIQKQIASILSAYDNLIENNTRRIEILEEMARRLYEEWFVKFRFPGHEEVEFKESELGLIPESWDLVPLGDIYRTGSGGTPSRKNPGFFGGDYRWVKTKELQDRPVFDTEEKISEEGLQKSSAKLFPRNTVLIAMYGATIGRLGLLLEESATNQACCAVLPNSQGCGWGYAYLSLFSRRQALIDLRAGAAQQNISQDVIKKFKLLRASDELHEQFEMVVTPFLTLCFTLYRKNANLRAQRDLLLPKLISGEIDVSDITMPT